MSWFAELARAAAALATGQMGWSPEAFWGATVAELQTALEGRLGPDVGAPLGRSEMAELETKENANGR